MVHAVAVHSTVMECRNTIHVCTGTLQIQIHFPERRTQPVVLVGVVTAVAFDKLSEVRKVEEDSQLRSEQREEERKEREKQINAVKNTSKPYIHRRTLRRAIEFYANIPTEAYKMVEGQRTEWHRSVSSPIGDVGGAIGKSLLNRMKSFRLSSSSEDVRKEEGEVDHTPPSEEQNTMSQDTLVHDGSGGDGGGGGGGGGVSVVSAVSLSRTLSEPVGADRTSHVEAMDRHLSRAGSNAQSGSVDLDVGKTQPTQLLRLLLASYVVQLVILDISLICMGGDGEEGGCLLESRITVLKSYRTQS